jgi:glucose-6-phosphate 1-dehydrogenase
VQPNEGISLRFGAKVPGHEFHIRKASMDFYYSHGYGGPRDDAYERVILDALIGDATLFIRADEVARSWRIVDPLLAYWHQAPRPYSALSRRHLGSPGSRAAYREGPPPVA